MKFVTLLAQDGNRLAGIINSSCKVVPFGLIRDLPGIKEINSVMEFIEKFGEKIPEGLAEQIENADNAYDLTGYKFLAPIPEVPRNVICLGKNYAEHVREIRDKIQDIKGLPQHPIYFSKRANPASAHEDNIMLDEEITGQLDYEAELAVVIGRKCRKVKRSEALDYVFGYTILNDLSARDLQHRHVQWFKGKNLDGYCPIGPWIVHSSAVGDPMKLNISCKVNGEVRQNSNTSGMIFDIPYIIEDLSSAMTLYPGDIISTGTPEGVGMGFNPPRYLGKGDVVECSIESIGILRNRII